MDFSSSTADAGRSVITVRAALQLPVVRRGSPEVVAGHDSLDRPVRWVHSGEVSHIASLLKGGELLLTTGMGIGRSASDQRRYMTELADCGIAGCVLELGTTYQEMPDRLATAAKAQGVPLIALHKEVRFIDITEAIHQEIVSRQLALMRRGDQIHRRFTELLLDGAGLPDILRALAVTIANPVLLLRSGQGVISHAVHHSPSSDVLAAWELARLGRTEAPRIVTLPVPTGRGETWGSLVSLAMDSPLEAFDEVALERAVPLIALTLLKNRQEEILAVQERGNFFTSLLELELEEAQAQDRAESMGFRDEWHCLLPVVVVRQGRVLDYARNDEASWSLVWRDVNRELKSSGTPAIGGIRGQSSEMLVVVGLTDDKRRADIADRVSDAIRRAATRHFSDGAELTIAVGATAGSWSEVRPALRETVECAWSTRTTSGLWQDATKADLDRLLWSIRSNAELLSFVERRLGPILEHDRIRKAKLLPTLEAYCAHGGRKAETARALHLERQSLYHRLERIEALLGEALDDEATQLSVHLAVRARKHLIDAGELVDDIS